MEAGDFYREVVAAAAAGELRSVTGEQKQAFARPVRQLQLSSGGPPSGLEVQAQLWPSCSARSWHSLVVLLCPVEPCQTCACAPHGWLPR